MKGREVKVNVKIGYLWIKDEVIRFLNHGDIPTNCEEQKVKLQASYWRGAKV